MERVNLTREDIKKMNFVSNSTSLVYYQNDLMYKIFDSLKVDMETEQKRVEYSENLSLYHIEKPKNLLYMDNKFIGFSSYKLEGIPLDKYLYEVLPSASYYNLELLASIFKNIEKIIIKASQEGIVLPDLGSLNNILVTKKGLYYIDYSGLQVKDVRTDDISNLLINNSWAAIFNCNKYFNENLLFTTELDKATLVYMFFSLAFRITLKNYNLADSKTLKTIFKEKFKINDPTLMYKVWLLYQNNTPNEFIADYILELSKNYKIVADYKNARRILVRK